MAFVTLWHTRYKLRRRNHGWPWLHTVRHSMLQQVATNKQYATRMLIIPVEKSLINSRPAIHLFNDSFPFTSGLNCMLRFKQTDSADSFIKVKGCNLSWPISITVIGGLLRWANKAGQCKMKANKHQFYIYSLQGPVFPSSTYELS